MVPSLGLPNRTAGPRARVVLYRPTPSLSTSFGRTQMEQGSWLPKAALLPTSASGTRRHRPPRARALARDKKRSAGMVTRAGSGARLLGRAPHAAPHSLPWPLVSSVRAPSWRGQQLRLADWPPDCRVSLGAWLPDSFLVGGPVSCSLSCSLCAISQDAEVGSSPKRRPKSPGGPNLSASRLSL